MEKAGFLEVKLQPDGRQQTFRCELVARGTGWVVLRYVTTRAWQVDDLEVQPGTLTYGYFWVDRPYNVYHWVSPEGRTIAYYINLSDAVRLEEDRILWVDLAADVLIRPGTPPQVLDTQELADLPRPLQDRARKALASVLDHWREITEEVEAWTRRLHAGQGPREM